ncbi:MAG: hypothetical protein GY832_04705 [Chloroflexi bacterium]|nr:hypothetical protein [Chloroflexota bacterium]
MGTLPLLEIEIAVSVSTDCHKFYRPDLTHYLRNRRAPVHSLAVFPWSVQVVHWLVSLGPGAVGCGVGSWGMGDGDAVSFGGTYLGRVLWFAVVGGGVG